MAILSTTSKPDKDAHSSVRQNLTGLNDSDKVNSSAKKANRKSKGKPREDETMPDSPTEKDPAQEPSEGMEVDTTAEATQTTPGSPYALINDLNEDATAPTGEQGQGAVQNDNEDAGARPRHENVGRFTDEATPHPNERVNHHRPLGPRDQPPFSSTSSNTPPHTSHTQEASQERMDQEMTRDQARTAAISSLGMQDLRSAASINTADFASQAALAQAATAEEEEAGTRLYIPVHFWPHVPTFEWDHDELPDPMRQDTVRAGALRFRYNGATRRLPTSVHREFMITTHREVMAQVQMITRMDFYVLDPFQRGGTYYIDVVISNKAFYQDAKNVSFQFKGRPVVLAYCGAPITERDIVMRINNLHHDIKAAQVFGKVKRVFADTVDISDCWGLFSPMVGDEGVRFAGVMYFFGRIKNDTDRTQLPAFVDLSNVLHGRREVIVHYDGRPNWCLQCRPTHGTRHVVDECPRQRLTFQG